MSCKSSGLELPEAIYRRRAHIPSESMSTGMTRMTSLQRGQRSVGGIGADPMLNLRRQLSQSVVMNSPRRCVTRCAPESLEQVG